MAVLSDQPSPYQPDRRTAVVLSGAGVAGAYHAGVLRALSEAGVRVDLVAARGVGAVGAIYSAVDGVARLWEPGGLWRGSGARRIYDWRPAWRRTARAVAGVALLLLVPAVLLAAGSAVYLVALSIGAIDAAAPGTVAGAWEAAMRTLFAPGALPTRLPQLVTAVLGVAVLSALVAAWRARVALPGRRRQRDGVWWTLFGAPLDLRRTADYFITGLWDLLRGGANVSQPARLDLSRRCAELLGENLGQPGFRELLILAHDLDARQDVVFALLAAEWRRPFLAPKPGEAADQRASATIDLSGAARDHFLDALAAALAIPGATDPHFVSFAPESVWRGETHRLVDRPGGLLRLLEEVDRAGVQQVVLVTSAPEAGGPHTLTTRRAEPRARLGEYLASAEAASVRDALRVAADWFDALFVVRPVHNPVAALDTVGVHDERSDRPHTLAELVDRGYEDAYRQFIDPVVGASGEQLAAPIRAGG